MKKFQTTTVKGLACSVSAMALVLSASAFAQDANQPTGIQVDGEEVDAADISQEEVIPAEGSIVVTGSRIKRDTYSSISPLQILTTDASQDVGQFDPAQILQRSESAAGQQIDATFQGFVLDNGPGSQTLNLRGLGADRTLLLVNGRRLAPAGVEGAPTNPSINLLPGSLIDRFDLLLDGASSVYGSDAVAGVGNIILRKDFDGPELFLSGNINPQGGGDDYTVSGAWGFNTDRAFFGIGAEYAYRDTIRLNDRDFFSGCDRNYEVDQAGNILTLGLAENAVVQNRTPGVRVSDNECKITGISGRIFIPQSRLGSVYFQPGRGNTAIPNYSESTNAFSVDLDTNGDGIRDVDFQDVNTNGSNLDAVFVSQQKLYNVMAYGEYAFPGEASITPYFEANYSRAEIFADNTGSPQLFPSVPGLNQFNPCNFQTNPNGVDCRNADNVTQGLVPGSPFFGARLSTGRIIAVQPIVSIRGDRNNTDVVQEQYRGVFGVKGDLPFISSSWRFDVSGVYSRSEGSSVRRGIREDKLAFALGIDPTVDTNGNGIADDYDPNAEYDNTFNTAPAVRLNSITPCNAAQLRNPSLAQPDLLAGCVPVNLFAPSVLGSPIGDFATQAERDYLFGTRTFDTTYEQALLSGFVTGDLFTLPAGNVAIVIGAEYRHDKIDSRPDAIAANGLFFGFFSDKGAQGSKSTKEVFGEIDIPLQAGKPWVEELNVNVSGRLTDDEFYGTNGTYSIKGGWRPISSLVLKMSYGTSFRAPNLRENFLLGQSGFNTLFDPCAVPVGAFIAPAPGQPLVYNPTLDGRDANVLANCRAEGRDPTLVGIDPAGLNTFQTSSSEITSGGSLDINPETSRSLTAGFAFEETFGGFDVSLGMNYFDIKLKDSIVEPTAQFILNDCYTRDDGQRSPFCDRIVTDTTGTRRFLVTGVNSGFINLNSESVRGIDINATFGKDILLFGKNVGLGMNLRANHLIERSSLFIDDAGNQTFDEDAGEFGLPKWTGTGTFTADVDRFRLTYQVRYTGPVSQDEAGVDAFSDAFNFGPNFVPGVATTRAGVIGDTCLGLGSRTGIGALNGNVAGDNTFCRDVGFASAQFLHTASLRYRDDSWTFRLGVSNIFDTAPPLVDSSEVLAIGNAAIGNGYDYDGREFFFQVDKAF